MIACAHCIGHGNNAVNYSVYKDRADLVKVNFLPDDITAEAMWQRMRFHLAKVAAQQTKGRPNKDTAIRMEISPTKEETAGWTMADWERFADEFIQAFDSVDMSNKTKRASSKATHVANSQYVASLHHDSKSGILHLHIVANRVDMDGNTNDGHYVGERAVAAADIVNLNRGWGNPKDIEQEHLEEISDACMEILSQMDRFSWKMCGRKLAQRGYKLHLHRDSNNKVTGYAIMRGNSSYKSSKLGKGRNLMPSTIMKTWTKLHSEQGTKTIVPKNESKPRTATIREPKPVQKPVIPKPMPKLCSFTIATDEYHRYPISIREDADNIIKQNCSVPDDNDTATIENVVDTARLLFAGYLDAATSMSDSCGGGGSDLGGWGKDKDEDELKWALRCAQMAHRMCKPAASRKWHR